MKEVFPVLSCDVELGETLSDIEFNVEGITAYMRERGFTDENITATHIHASNQEINLIPGANPGDYYTLGIAMTSVQHVTIFPNALAAKIKRAARTNDQIASFMAHQKPAIEQMLSCDYSQIVAHELEHVKVYLEEGDTGIEHKARALGAAALSSPEAAYRAYKELPEEIRCDEAGMNAPDDLVSLRYR